MKFPQPEDAEGALFQRQLRRKHCKTCPYQIYCESGLWPDGTGWMRMAHSPDRLLFVHGTTVAVRCRASSFRTNAVHAAVQGQTSTVEVHEGINLIDTTERTYA